MPMYVDAIKILRAIYLFTVYHCFTSLILLAKKQTAVAQAIE